MTITESNLNQLFINELTQAEYNAATINQNELYIVKDGVMQSTDVINALGYTPYNSTNPNGFITSSALNGYATESWVNNKGYITGISSGDVTTALGYTPANNTDIDGQWTSVSASSSQVVSSVSLNYSSNYSISLASILPTNDTYEIIVTGRATTGTTSGNYAQVRLSVTGFPASVLVCRCRTRSNSAVESEGTATILYTKGTSTLSLERSTDSNLKGTADLWVLAYRKVR